MATKYSIAPRFAPPAGSLAAKAAATAGDFYPDGDDMIAAWMVAWQACHGFALVGDNGIASRSCSIDFEPVRAVVGRMHLMMESEAELRGARRVLEAMLDLCGQETRSDVFALAGER